MYYERLPAYEYELPCGHTFRSLTRSVPYVPGAPARHYFHCTRCNLDHSIKPADLIERRPGNPRKPLGDNELGVRIDSAIKADRVREYYLRYWDSRPFWDVCRTLGIHDRIVRRVAAELGVYEYQEGSADRRIRDSDRSSAKEH